MKKGLRRRRKVWWQGSRMVGWQCGVKTGRMVGERYTAFTSHIPQPHSRTILELK